MTRHPNREQGDFAEGWVADRDENLEHAAGEASWYDVRRTTTGAKGEVKSTHETIKGAHNDAGNGEFRLWESQHRSLLAADASGVAWYHFVVLDDDGHVVGYARRKPKTVSSLVESVGGWSLAGHDDRDGRQCRLPWSAIDALK